MWQGKLAHKVIETIVLPEAKARRWPRPERVIDQAIALAERQFKFSRNETYQTTAKAAAGESYCILAPHNGRVWKHAASSNQTPFCGQSRSFWSPHGDPDH